MIKMRNILYLLGLTLALSCYGVSINSGWSDRTDPDIEKQAKLQEAYEKTVDDRTTLYTRPLDSIKYDPIDFQTIIYANEHPEVKNLSEIYSNVQIEIYNSLLNIYNLQLKDYNRQMLLYSQELNKYNANTLKLERLKDSNINKKNIDSCISTGKEVINSQMSREFSPSKLQYEMNHMLPKDAMEYSDKIASYKKKYYLSEMNSLLTSCIRSNISEKDLWFGMQAYGVNFGLNVPEKPNPPNKPVKPE